MSSDDNSVRIHDYSRTSDHAAESTKNVARDIRESSSTTKQLIHTLVRTGTFEEIARAILPPIPERCRGDQQEVMSWVMLPHIAYVFGRLTNLSIMPKLSVALIIPRILKHFT